MCPRIPALNTEWTEISHLFPEGSFWGTFLFLMSLSMELEELPCLELWCLNKLGYFLSKDCSLLKEKETMNIKTSWCTQIWIVAQRSYVSKRVAVKICVPLQLFLFELQLQHHSTELHVKVVSPLQLPLIVLTDVQSMPENKGRRIELREHPDPLQQTHVQRQQEVGWREGAPSCQVPIIWLILPLCWIQHVRRANLSSSLRRLISSSSSRWRQVPSDLIFSKCCFTSSLHSACPTGADVTAFHLTDYPESVRACVIVCLFMFIYSGMQS